MKVLVTGAAGLVGSHAAEHFATVDKSNQVVAYDNLMRSYLFGCDAPSVSHNWQYLGRYSNIKRIQNDIRNQDALIEAMDGCDAIIHCAGQPGVPLSMRIPMEDFSINGHGTMCVLETARQNCPKAKIIYTSTNKVYGENPDGYLLTEKETRYDLARPSHGISENLSVDHTGHTPYGASKYVGDIYVQEYGHNFGMNTCVFRMSCIYGTRQFGFEDQGWVSHFIISVLKGRRINIFGNGKQVRDCLYVKDLIKAFDAYLKSDLKGSQVFNIGGGRQNTTSLLEFLDLLRIKLDMPINVDYLDWRPSDQKLYISDIYKVMDVLGWRQEWTFERGVQEIIDWCKSNTDILP